MSKRKGANGGGGNVLHQRIPRKRVGRSFAARRKALVDQKRAGANVDDFIGRSGLEDKLGNFLREHGIEFGYESDVVEYTVPEKVGKYTPDFKIGEVYLETKGRFTSEDRKKMLFVFRSNPDLNLLMVFPKPLNTITRKSKTTYADWCDKNGIPWLSIEELEHLIKTRKNYVDLLLKRANGLGSKGNHGRRARPSGIDGSPLSTAALGSINDSSGSKSRRRPRLPGKGPE
jgi:hypothetical protein